MIIMCHKCGYARTSSNEWYEWFRTGFCWYPWLTRGDLRISTMGLFADCCFRVLPISNLVSGSMISCSKKAWDSILDLHNWIFPEVVQMPNLTQSILLAVEYVNGRMPGLDGWMYGTFGHFFVLGCMFQSWGCKIIGRLLLLNDLILNSTSGGILDSSRLGSQLFSPRASELRVLLKRGGKI